MTTACPAAVSLGDQRRGARRAKINTGAHGAHWALKVRVV